MRLPGHKKNSGDMVYDGNRSHVGSAFPTRIGTEDVTMSDRAGTGWLQIPGRRESGRGEYIVGNGETCNSSSSKSVPGSSDETAANPGAAAHSGTEPLEPGASSTGGEARLDDAAGRATDGRRRSLSLIETGRTGGRQS